MKTPRESSTRAAQTNLKESIYSRVSWLVLMWTSGVSLVTDREMDMLQPPQAARRKTSHRKA